MLTWAIAWMAVKREFGGEGLAILLFCSIIADTFLLGFGCFTIFG